MKEESSQQPWNRNPLMVTVKYSNAMDQSNCNSENIRIVKDTRCLEL